MEALAMTLEKAIKDIGAKRREQFPASSRRRGSVPFLAEIDEIMEEAIQSFRDELKEIGRTRRRPRPTVQKDLCA
jgi:hypothetical protein